MKRFFLELADGRNLEDAWAAVSKEWLQQGLEFGDEEWDDCETRIDTLIRLRRIAHILGMAAGKDPNASE